MTPSLFSVPLAPREQGQPSSVLAPRLPSAQKLLSPEYPCSSGKGEGPGVCLLPPPSSSVLCADTTLQGEHPGMLLSTSLRLYVCLSLKEPKNGVRDGSRLLGAQSFCSSGWPGVLVSVIPGLCDLGRAGGGSRGDGQPFLVQLFPLTSVGGHGIQHRLQFHIDLHQCLQENKSGWGRDEPIMALIF